MFSLKSQACFFHYELATLLTNRSSLTRYLLSHFASSRQQPLIVSPSSRAQRNQHRTLSSSFAPPPTKQVFPLLDRPAPPATTIGNCLGAPDADADTTRTATAADMSSAPVILQATAKHTSTLIFLHGLGDTGHGWLDALAQCRPAHMKVICPTAKIMPVSLNGGFRMNSWFDLRTLDITGPEDEPGIKEATQLVHGLIAGEVQAGIPHRRIVLGGFSQGGALALYAGLTQPERLGGIVGFSCWLPLHKTFPEARQTPVLTPVFQCHGDCDPVVPYKMGQMTASILKAFMTECTFSTYRGMSHSSSPDELDDLKTFIEKHVQPQ